MSQPMIAVRDVPASARWYTELLGCESDHGRADFDRIVSAGRVLLMLHRLQADEHGLTRKEDDVIGNGVLLWFFVSDIDRVYGRAMGMDVPIIVEPHRNPMAGWTEFTAEDPDGYRLAIASFL